MYENRLLRTNIGFVDLNTKLEWLSLRKTNGLSPIDSSKENSTFRLASTDELTELFNALFHNSDANQELLTYCRCSLLLDLFGTTYNIGNRKSSGLNGFIFQETGDIESPTVKQISVNSETQTSFFGAIDLQIPLSGATHRNDIATFLLR